MPGRPDFPGLPDYWTLARLVAAGLCIGLHRGRGRTLDAATVTAAGAASPLGEGSPGVP